MAEPEGPTLPSKRKSDPDLQDIPPKVAKPTPNDDTPQLPNSSPEPLQNDNNDHQNDYLDEVQEDLKGKGIMRDDKGKGKMIVEDDDGGDDGPVEFLDFSDDDSDSESDDDDDDGSDDGSDFSDDPLTEVDLNNILPTRTRGRAASSGVRIADNAGNTASATSLAPVPLIDDDSSDDSDA